MRAWNFYANEAADHRGRTLKEILAWDDDALEDEHDFIQWLFPLTERSGVNPNAPILSSEEMQLFHQSPEVQARVEAALHRMLNFYGLRLTEIEHTVRVEQAANYSARRVNWMTRGNHNFLRITRILKSLRLLGLSVHTSALFECLKKIFAEERVVIGADTFAYWQRVVQ